MIQQSDEVYHPDDIVITGASGAFPQSENIDEFSKKLLSGEDMISMIIRDNASVRIGSMKNIDRFDHSFFHVTRQQAQAMTIANRMILEKTFEAILDAGYNPSEIKGKNIAVVCGVWDGGVEGDPSEETDNENFVTVIGRSQFMIANRVSNWLDIHGPSFAVNSACSSSMYALDNAIKCMQIGKYDGAIVCAPNFCFTQSQVMGNNPLNSSKGNSSPFDAAASGYVRAEAVVVIFLQRRKDARRIYANIIHSTTNCDGFKQEGFSHPSVAQQKRLYEQFYKEIDIDPRLISYFEAHGTGTPVGDMVEGTSIEEFFCQGRNTPLKIGTVKSNIGHSEAAAALCSIVKLIVSFESGIIPANLRYQNPNPNIKGLLNGNLEVIVKPTPLEGKYFALNSFGIGGANGHLLVTPHNKIKKPHHTLHEKFPYIVTVSGRTDEAVDSILNDVEKHHTDIEYIALMHKIFGNDIGGHLHRGYIILRENEASTFTKSKTHFSGEKRPIWFVFSGMGSQWPRMGKSLMNIPVFAESIKKSHQILQTKGLDLIRIITEDDPQIFKHILNSFVGIASIQIALIDTLKSLQIQPDGIIGHSVGELGCAYADGCFTAEQMILAAYYRGLVSSQMESIHGTMASIGASYEAIRDVVPAEIDIACHNSSTNCTISGPTSTVKKFVEHLKQTKIFAREVETSNIAYHSRYIAPAAPKLITYLKQVIPEPKLRSDKWISTSVSEHEWNTKQAKYSSAEYHTNNLLKPVLFEEGCRHIPSNAITIEIAPHGLLNAILKRSLPSTVQNIPLTMRNTENCAEFLLNAIGRMYEAGCAPKLDNLYPPVEFPVSRSTPMISSLVKWQHDEQWPIGKLNTDVTSTERIFHITFSNDEEFLKDHIIDGRNLYPAFGYLWLVLETVSIIQKKKPTEVSVIFENVRFERATNIPEKKNLKFHVTVLLTTNHFEVTESGTAVATGIIRVVENPQKESIKVTPHPNQSSRDVDFMTTKDFYKELRLRGYHYRGAFKRVACVSCKGNYGEISWSNNFVTFMDNMAQIMLLQIDSRELMIPTYMSKILIDFKKHFEILKSSNEQNPKLPVSYYPQHKLLNSGGIQISGCKCTQIARRKIDAEPVLEKHQFVPYISDEEMDLNLAVRLCVQVALENTPSIQVKTYELLENDHRPDIPLISPAIVDTLGDFPLIRPDVNILKNAQCTAKLERIDGIVITENALPKDKSGLIIILTNLQDKLEATEDVLESLRDDGFVISRESTTRDPRLLENLGFNVCFSRAINAEEKILLLSKKMENKLRSKFIQISSSSYSWVPKLQSELSSIEPEQEKLIVYSEKDPFSGILGFFNCLRKEEKGMATRCFCIIDEKSLDWKNPFFASQLDKNLSHNFYKNGQWGSYRRLRLEPPKKTKTSHALCVIEERGNLSSFKWIEGSYSILNNKTSSGKPLAHVYYSSLNFRDVMMSIGKISEADTIGYNRLMKCYLGFEYSGIDQNGKRIMGVLDYGGISTMVETLPRSLWQVPDYMTLEEAATIPVVYSTVVYAFFIAMKLRKGSSVLIHAGSGGVGQAAINICLYYKCNIFTTVGTPEKVEFIKKTFPQIPESHIGNSRDTSFLQLIMDQTNGRGVDAVLNSLSEEKLQASVRCLAAGGHFLEIGKFDMSRNNSLELAHFLNRITFHSIHLDSMAESEEIHQLREKLQEMLNQRIIKPIQRMVYQSNEVESAIRFMAAGKHTGKILIKIRDEDKVHGRPTLHYMDARPRVLCDENKSYVIIGGLGGFGLELADWLILRGARKLVLSSRTGIRNGYQNHRMMLWRSYGAEVMISTEDVTKELGIRGLLTTAKSLAPVAGIFNLAVILKDNPFSKQTEESFDMVAGPKSIATAHLDKLSRKMCPGLEHFVVFTSVANGLGNHNQTNYGFANSVMERICEKRNLDGLPALAIQWGAIGDVGIVADFAEDNISVVIGGTLQQKIKSCLSTLDALMKQSFPVVGSMIVAEKHHSGSDVISAVANVLGIKDLKTINLTWTLPELGMDSIVATEIKQILDMEFNTFFTPEELRTMDFAKLYNLQNANTNMSKSDVIQENTTPLLRFFKHKQFTNKFILRLPFDEEEIDKPLLLKGHPTVFVFPGIEGFAITMEQMTKNFPLQVLCFQYYLHGTTDYSFFKLPHQFAQFISENLDNDEEFYLVAYSVGGLLALQVADILEKQGRKGYLYLIETSPSFMKAMVAEQKQKIGFTNEENLQNLVCHHAMQNFALEISKENMKIIEQARDWQSKKNHCFSSMSREPLDENMMNRSFDQMLITAKELFAYEMPPVLLQTPCVLIRCTKNVLDSDKCYGLSKYFKNPVEVHQIDANHFSILSNPRTAEIIMQSRSWEIRKNA